MGGGSGYINLFLYAPTSSYTYVNIVHHTVVVMHNEALNLLDTFQLLYTIQGASSLHCNGFKIKI